MCSWLYYRGLCKYTLWRSHNDKVAFRRISQNVSPSLSDAYLYCVVRRKAEHGYTEKYGILFRFNGDNGFILLQTCNVFFGDRLWTCPKHYDIFCSVETDNMETMRTFQIMCVVSYKLENKFVWLMFFWPSIMDWLYINYQLLCTDYYLFIKY